jgi:uncharacterized membrane protein YfcA
MTATTAVAIGVLALLAGTLMGLLGGGGGFLYVLILLVVTDLPAHTAVGTAVATAAVGATVSVVGHHRGGMVAWRWLPAFLVAGAIGAVAAALLTSYLPQDLLIALIVGVYALVGVLALRLGRAGGAPDRPPPPPGRVRVGRGVVGAVTGITVSAFAVNGGGLISGYLTAYEHRDPRRAVGTAVAVLSPLSVVGAVTHVASGGVDLAYALALAPGAAAGGYLGARLTRLVRTRVLAQVVGVLTLLTIVPLLMRR